MRALSLSTLGPEQGESGEDFTALGAWGCGELICLLDKFETVPIRFLGLRMKSKATSDCKSTLL